MTTDPNSFRSDERRQHQRHRGEGWYLEIAGAPARLVDWSLGGLGVEIEQPGSYHQVGERVTARILRKDGKTWTELQGTVRRVQGNVLGLSFDYGVADGFATLMDLLAHKPALK